MYVGVDCCLHADKLDSRAGWFKKKSVSERIITDISLILSLFQSMSKGTEKTIFFFGCKFNKEKALQNSMRIFQVRQYIKH